MTFARRARNSQAFQHAALLIWRKSIRPRRNVGRSSASAICLTFSTPTQTFLASMWMSRSMSAIHRIPTCVCFGGQSKTAQRLPPTRRTRSATNSARRRRIELKVERRRLHGLLLLRCQARERIREGIGDPEFH